MFKKVRGLLVLAACLSLLVFAVGCGGTANEAKDSEDKKADVAEVKGSLTAVGSTALQPLVEQSANQFMSKNPDVQITVQGGGSGTGLAQVSSGAAQIGNSDLFAEEKDGIDASILTDHKVAVVGFAAVVNPSVGVDNLTKQQLIDIFTGKTTNWKEVGGKDQEIVVVNRAKGSGTRASFKKYALDNQEEVKGLEEDSSGTVKKIVNETPGTISYLALSYVDDKVKALKIDGVEPNKESITTGKYNIWSYQHMYTKGAPEGAAKAFLDYMLTDDVQVTLVPQLGYIPVKDMQVEKGAK
ncbi:phosphate ABC transporter substrate-binding protein [Desulfotomaculum sp. 1211_IL3151]|uniref:phosphate ABC transporter substrate-binding protein n=1 Tax=Desulfotomaculum sp. 1211_IL3151 TaxID=3084055 RepID=UPI002FD89A32